MLNSIWKVSAVIAAALLIIASAGFAAYFTWTLNQHEWWPLIAFAVAFALGLELAKPLAVNAIGVALRSWRLGQAAILSLFVLVAVAYSLTASLQLMARTRSDGVSERLGTSQAASDARKTLEGLRTELASTHQARSPAELQPLIDAKLVNPKLLGCTAPLDDPKLRATCGEVATLRAEAARAERRAILGVRIAALETAASTHNTAKSERVADPSAVALATYLRAFGVQVEAQRLGDWLVLVGVIALEVGALFSVVLVQAASSPAPAQSVQVVDPPRAPARPAQGAPVELVAEHHGATPGQHVLSIPDDPAERIVQLVRDRGGRLFGSQREIAKALGVSVGSVNAALEKLSTGGRVARTSTAKGTHLELVA